MKRAGTVPWPEHEAERYTAAGHWRGRPLGDWMWSWSESYGSRTALVDGATRIGYRELAVRADALAERLVSLGLGDGDNLLVQLPNCWEFVALFLACQRIGVAPVLALMPHREHELEYLAELADVAAIAVPDTCRDFDHQTLAAKIAGTRPRPVPVLVVGDRVEPGHVDLRAALRIEGDAEERRGRLDERAPDAGEVALFLLSGGTTGLPKIIARTHNDYEYNFRRSGEVCGFTAETTYLAVLPLAHNFPLGCPGVLGTLAVGGLAVLSPSPHPRTAFAEIARERVTITSVVPAVAHRWLEHAGDRTYDLTSLELVQVGGSVLPAELARELGPGLGCTLQQVYGMAEGLLNYTRPDDPSQVLRETQGRPISEADEILVVDAEGRPVPDGATGELLTRGPYTPRGYYRAPQHNQRAFTADGWYRTGDLVRWHPSGNLVVEGRLKDLVNRGGEKVSIDEVEDLVRAVPGVADAAALALPDPALGERVGICVIPGDGPRPTLETVHAFFAARGVAAFKTPELLYLVEEFPLTPVGKVDRRTLRERILALAEVSVPAQPKAQPSEAPAPA
ncbi:(2,3-dihydroxybenzoyl)adenylate synthase [Streptomyces violascens]|uniref:2,3-dihydroxybenzoate-AMP ligase n=1 Tax=Streptomyces violascens TaxID=67381 RepID=A0ABQ3QYT8_9ACTN|nr:AMP-binding protein [Streptomyces violascens]GGU40057.1 2,3-dihydroxybenzoate-AMP ligase [Streptomyces violascens]GHI42451.1 2,3-dihydroxybenzoate-AMP ligase [Streptomyces violascens]